MGATGSLIYFLMLVFGLVLCVLAAWKSKSITPLFPLGVIILGVVLAYCLKRWSSRLRPLPPVDDAEQARKSEAQAQEVKELRELLKTRGRRRSRPKY